MAVGSVMQCMWLTSVFVIFKCCVADINGQPPQDWVDGVMSGDILYRNNTGDHLDVRLLPSIGNGFLATLAGSNNTYIAGVYNQVGPTEPFRASLPGLAAMWISGGSGGVRSCIPTQPASRVPCGVAPFDPAHCMSQGCCFGSFSPDPHSFPWCYSPSNDSTSCSPCEVVSTVPVSPQEWADEEALDMANRIFLRRKTMNITSSAAPTTTTCNVSIEQRTYAHFSRKQLLVTEFDVDATSCSTGYTWTLQLDAGAGADPLVADARRADFNWSQFAESPIDVKAKHTDQTTNNHFDATVDIRSFVGFTLVPENRGRLVGVALTTVAPTSGYVDITLTPGQRTVHSYPTAFATDADNAGMGNLSDLAANASNALATAVELGATKLLLEHTTAVKRDHTARVELVGDLDLARLINATAYTLSASLAAGVDWSTAPGGLSTGGRFTADGVDTHGGGGYPEGGSSYYGHVFWDADVWMLPALLPLRPDVARSMINYRKNTIAAAKAHAHSEGLNGTKWVWESAFSGTSATGGDCQEIHLQAGIGMAIRQYYRVTQDRAWLVAQGWPMLMEFVEFFKSRAVSLPNGSLSLNKVQSPNEYAAGIDNDIYTNTAFAMMLEWIGDIAEEVGVNNSFTDLGQRLLIPFNATLQRHIEYTNAPTNLRIKQATMTMVPYPVMYPMPAHVQRNDLEYEATHIGNEGPAMTHSMLAIDWLSMGNVSGGNIEFERSYVSNVFGPYRQWMECPLPPDFCQGHRPATNFLTAAGGFTQTILYGFLGLRYYNKNMTITPALMANVTTLAFRGLHWNASVFDVTYTAHTASITLQTPSTNTRSSSSNSICAFVNNHTPQILNINTAVVMQLPATVVVATCSAST